MEGLLDETPGHHYEQQHKAKIEKVSSAPRLGEPNNFENESQQLSALEIFNRDL